MFSGNTLEYTAGVEFAPVRVVRPAPDSGYPALEARAGSTGRTGYSPFVRLADGVMINAPIIADETGALDRVVELDVARRQVKLRMSRGYANDRHAWYISTEASDENVAAFERATFVPSLAAAPGTARSGILAIVNGVTDRRSPDRQGMQSALLNDLSPLNVLQHAPDPTFADSSYSPVWDLHLGAWTTSAIRSEPREKIFTWDEGARFGRRGLLASPSPNGTIGGLRAAGVAINCPVIVLFNREPPPLNPLVLERRELIS